MILLEMAMQIKNLAHQGVQKSKIAQRRQTVYNHLERDDSFPRPRLSQAMVW